VAGLPLYRTPLQADWIDYNGHLRDAYYGLIVSLATDALMDRVGLDAAYRASTRGTLYTVELHIHFLHELKQSDQVAVALNLLGCDSKRIHAAFEICRAADGAVAATAEVMLLHVVQQPAGARTAPFPAEVDAQLAQLSAASAALPPPAPGSRRMELRGRPTPV
jgi:acyl-CoA thioester hydrolase